MDISVHENIINRLPFLLFALKFSAGRKAFLPVEPQSVLSFLFLLGAPRFA
jgi:hypothetical protein